MAGPSAYVIFSNGVARSKSLATTGLNFTKLYA